MSSLSAQARRLIEAISSDKSNEDIALAIQHGDEELMFELWLRVCRIIARCATQFYGRYASRCQAFGVTVDDLEQEGYFAVREAVGSFRLESGYRHLCYELSGRDTNLTLIPILNNRYIQNRDNRRNI